MLWVVARCSDDLAAAHYRLAHAVPMVGLWPTTEPNHIFYWNYNRLKHALGGRTFWVVAHCSNDLAAADYRLSHTVLMVGLWPTTEPYHILYWNYNRLKHALGGRRLWLAARCSDDLAEAHH